jgi:spermidine synthase
LIASAVISCLNTQFSNKLSSVWPGGAMRWFFGFFFVSGFCSILYELVWLRLSMAQFAVTTALVSIVLSAFMIGLGFGSWGAGYYLRTRKTSPGFSALRFYALTELLIGIAAILVRYELLWGRMLLERLDAGNALSPAVYYVAAGIAIGLTLVPWCACMGATFPFAMAAIKGRFSPQSARSFSYLYLANVLGAVMGASIPLLLIEEFGFKGTLHIGAVLNFSLAASAFVLSFSRASKATAVGTDPFPAGAPLPAGPRRWAHSLVFATGFTSMGVEVVWIRLFTPALGTVVYAFAAILGLYLAATYAGSWFYRRTKWGGDAPGGLLLACLALSVLLPLLFCDPRLPLLYPLRVAGILPFSFIVGFITPMLLDRVSLGDPDRAGKGYAINIAGCVLGPLASGFVLLPWLGERGTLLAFTLPWIALSSWKSAAILAPDAKGPSPRWQPATVALISLALVVGTKNFESQFSPREVRRDSTATVTALGATRIQKQLLVNGIGMSGLTPITKMIAHLPLAAMQRPPRNALVICFGMGTTHRSMLSWGIPSTAVELVPSVVSVFPFFHADAAQVMRSPLSRIVVDDGRFYLERSVEQYDIIVLDPPPPVEAAASSLLYSKEFYAIARLHLRPDGILQQWFPMGGEDPAIVASVAKALQQSFPYVRAFRSIEGWGYHFLASASPIPPLYAATMARRMPPSAAADLVEWGPAANAEAQFSEVLQREVSLESLIQQAPAVQALQDDHPVNEYFILRRVQDPNYMGRMWKRWLARVGIRS